MLMIPGFRRLRLPTGYRIDISSLEALDGSKHNRFATLVKVIPRMADARFSSLAQAGAFILEPISATLVSSYQ